MAVHTKDTKNSTGAIRTKANSQGTSGNANTSTSSSANSSEFASDAILIDLIKKCLTDMNELQKDIVRVEKEQDRTRNFYKAITKLSKASIVAITILMIIPILQLIACTAVVYYLGIQDQLPGLLIWILSGVSLLSIAEVIVTTIKYFSLENKVDELEKRFEKLVDTRNE